jgi:hypothetical protein
MRRYAGGIVWSVTAVRRAAQKIILDKLIRAARMEAMIGFAPQDSRSPMS